MFKVLLCIPPDYGYNYPPLGTPALTAFLKEKKIPVGQCDLNLRYRAFLARKIVVPFDDPREVRALLPSVLKEFFSLRLKKRYYSKLLSGMDDGVFPYLPYDNNTNSSFHFTERLLSSKFLWRYLEDTKENTFLQFFEEEKIIEKLKSEEIRLLGISIISPSQVIPSLTLGLLIKKRLPHIHVSIGGQWPTLYREEIKRERSLFKAFDSVIAFEGETPLAMLAAALQSGKDIGKIPDLIVASSDPKKALLPEHEESIDMLPCPDFDGLPLGDYDDVAVTKKINITYQTSRGCYWSKCAYCVDLPLPKAIYKRRSPALVVRDLEKLKKLYNVGHIAISDPGVSPRQMLEVSKGIIKNRIEIDWWCMARLDRGFTEPLFRIAKQAGLKQVNFGFESATDKICNLLDKGNFKTRSSEVIKACSRSGVKVALQTITGLPGESPADALETIDFLYAHKKHIAEVVFNIYYLTPGNYVHLDPDRYSIVYKRNVSLPFRFFHPFVNKRGMSMPQAFAMQNVYWALFNKSKRKDSRPSVAKRTGKTPRASLAFSLNGETITMPISYNRSNLKRSSGDLKKRDR